MIPRLLRTRCYGGGASVLLLSLVLVMAVTLVAAETTPEYGIRDKTPQLVAFTGARIVESPDLFYEKGVLLVNNGRVVAVGADVQIPTAATVIDLRGYTIYPGFIDPLTNYGIEKPERGRRRSNSPPKYEGDRTGGNAWNDAIHAEKDWVDSFRPDRREAEEFVKQGFTVVQSAKLDGIFRGRGFVATLRDALPNDIILNPTSMHFLSFTKGSSRQEYPSSLMGAIALIRQTLYDVDWYQQAHRAYRLNPDQRLPEFNAAIEALADIRNHPVLFDAGDFLSIPRADRIAREFDLSLVQVGSGHEYERPEMVKNSGNVLILPVDFPEAPNVESLEDQLDVSLAQLRHWERAPGNATVMAENQIPFAFTSNGLKDKSDFLDNVRRTVDEGLSRRTALAALTTVPAGICGLSDRIGTLESGMLANFLVCDCDIFDEDAILYSVWIQGREWELKPRPEVDFRGEYDISIAGQVLQLELSGTIDKPRGACKLGARSVKLESLNTDGSHIEFSFKLDTLGLTGVLRFNGRIENGVLAGQYLNAEGELLNWIAERSGEYKAPPDSSQSKPGTGSKLVSRLTFPNKAFGLEEPPPSQAVLVRNATIWTSEQEGELRNADLLVRDGRFVAVGHGLEAPADAVIIDGTDKYVTAGIIDQHSHIAIAGDVNEGSVAVTSEVRIADVIDPADISIYRQLAGGVTASQLLHGSANPIGGQVQTIKLRWGNDADGLILESPPAIKFALGENVKQSNWGEKYRTRYPQSRTGVEAIIRDAFQAAREYENSWQAFRALDKKQKDKSIPPRRDLGLDALAEILLSERFIACHAYVAPEMLMLVRLAEEFGFMVRTFEHGLEAYKIASELAAAGVGLSTFSDWWAYKFEVYDAIPQNAGLCTEKGVLVSVKSDDADLARRLNQEAGKSVMYTDMMREEAIKLVTINPARQLMVSDRIGSIKVGKDADFVIWDGVPLSVYSKPLQTWIEGRKYFDINGDNQMREQLLAEKNALVQKVLAEKNRDKPKKRERGSRGPGPGDPELEEQGGRP